MAKPNLRAVAAADARKYGIPANVFEQQIQQESGFNPNAKSSAGAEGIAQFMPTTARGFGLTNPFDPVQALDAAARYDAGLLHKYGSLQSMLSAYNSGSPTAYKDPNFAKGQTYNYVRSILGGAGSASSSAGTRAPMSVGAPVPSPSAPTGNLSPLLGSLIASTNQSLGLGSSPNLASLFAQTTRPATPAAPAKAPVTAGRSSGGYASVDGVKVDSLIAPQVQRVLQQFGVTPTSGLRDAAHNASVGGASNSDHLRGDAVDFGGSPQQLAALYRYAQGRYPYVEPMAQAKNHVHISFKR